MSGSWARSPLSARITNLFGDITFAVITNSAKTCARSESNLYAVRSFERPRIFVVKLVKRAQSDRVSSTPGIFETSKTYLAGVGSAGKRSRGVAESKMDVDGEEL